MFSWNLLEDLNYLNSTKALPTRWIDHKITLNEPKKLDYKLKIEDEKLIASVDVPGVEISDLAIEIQDRYLTISALRDGQKRTISLCINADFDIALAEARLTNGVLKIFCPKRQSPIKKTISIAHG